MKEQGKGENNKKHFFTFTFIQKNLYFVKKYFLGNT